ncbi:cytochrome P450 [Catellatospora sp. TT07R-123]|uniref:cytochrome P450 n=1 Tax=Catellatospora sp. TT07R-123 TaxID=2733863 RepID=UPI001B110670|nr:cytochrome P450 [Catellatospora sp. TT07R-123]GHJ43215.1 cytochrome P450 [Catellatospora sp. TT07R-123]
MTTTANAPAPAPRLREPIPLVSHLRAFIHDPLELFDSMHASHGDVVEFFMAGDRWVLLSHPDDIERVHLETTRNYRKGYQEYKKIGYVFSRTLGNGLVTSEGSFWRTQRRLAQPAFHTKRVQGYADTMVDYTRELIDTWRPGDEFDMRILMGGLTQRVAGKSFFGTDTEKESSRASQALDKIMLGFNVELGSMVLERLPAFVPTRNRRRVDSAISDFEDVIAEFIANRRAAVGEHADLLAMLVESRDDDGSQMSDKQLRDELVTMYVAAQETTTSTLAWIWYFLGTRPDLAARVYAEVDSVLGGAPATAEKMGELKLLRAVVDEVLRLYPPAWRVFRVPDNDVEFQGYRVKAGTMVAMSQWITHRDPRWFDKPTEFDPDRWLDGRTANLHRYAYWPFGGGPRMCIGNGFALMEIVLIAATIAQRVRYTLLDHDVKPYPMITLRPSPGVRVRVDSVAGAQ